MIGPNAEDGVIQGGGSAQLTPHYSISPLAGLVAALPEASVTHHRGCVADRYVPQVDAADWQPMTHASEGSTDEGSTDGPLLVEIFDNPELAGQPAVRRTSRNLFAFYHGDNTAVPEAERWSQRWTGSLAIAVGGTHRFGILAVGRSRVLVNGRLVADNWTAPQPGQAFFEKASEEVIGSIELEVGTVAEIVVEWSGGEDHDLAGLRFGHRPPLDEDAMLDEAVAMAADAEAAVVVVGLTAEWETESHDRIMFGLPGRQDELVTRIAAVNPRTVVVLNAGGPVDLPWLDEVPAAIMAWYPGQEFGSALADVLLGNTDPGGRLPVTFPRRLEDAPTAGSVPGDGEFLEYAEGLLIGHRWYTEHGTDPLLPFGHGLSYTRFDFGPAVVDAEASAAGLTGRGPAVVTVPVSNVGLRAGKCVVQVYLRPGIPGRPRVLAGFGATTIEPGRTETVSVPIDPPVLRAWDGSAELWAPLSGTHILEIATSSTAVEQTVEITVD
ncbi:MAG: glycoside hydrolase family 3 C-terminal domain-containing protein [Acidimicrobiales bacterium]